MSNLLALALQSLESEDALPVFGDAMLEAELSPVQRLRVLRAIAQAGDPKRKMKPRTMRRAGKKNTPAKPTTDLARAVAALLLTESWKGPWMPHVARLPEFVLGSAHELSLSERMTLRAFIDQGSWARIRL